MGTAVALFHVLKRQHENLALVYVAARIVECVFIAVGILCVLSVVTLHQVFTDFWALSLGIYLIVKGFKPSPITADMEPTTTQPIPEPAV